ncbi:hypothetical protein K1719_024546 [Acacia pycnantha]|nr:hypothetical protein K1719_024546 [Acacia pycnantha]
MSLSSENSEVSDLKPVKSLDQSSFSQTYLSSLLTTKPPLARSSSYSFAPDFAQSHSSFSLKSAISDSWLTSTPSFTLIVRFCCNLKVFIISIS